MRNLLNDLRYSARLLRRSPGFTAVAVAALALGIGANTAIFSVIDTLLLRPLPYSNPDRIAVVWEHNLPRDRRNNVVSPGNFIHWRELNQAFTEMSAVSMTFRTTLTGAGDAVELPLQMVSGNLLRVLGVRPALGRDFEPQEDAPRAAVALISDRLWRQRFGADPAVVNRTVTMNGQPTLIVGVMPPGFSILDKNVDVWSTIGLPPSARTPRGRWICVVGRVKDGVTMAQAQEDMKRVHAELTARFPAFNTGWTANVVPLKQQLTGDVRPALWVMLGAVGFVLLIACANVGNLVLARATARQRELAVRAALGADRGRLVRQMLAESLLLSLLGAAAGLGLAWSGLLALRTTVAERLPIVRLEQVGINGKVLLFAIAAAVVSALVFGIAPALTSAGAKLTDTLKDGGRSGSAARGARVRSAFVVVEIALALILLVGAGLLLRSFVTLLRVDPGFDPARTITVKVSIPTSRYPDAERQQAFFNQLFERFDALPGVIATGSTSFLPMAGLGAATGFAIVGQPRPPAGQEPVTDVRVVANNYFKAMGVPVLRGRAFDARDNGTGVRRVIVNQALANRHFRGQDPIGKSIIVSWNDEAPDEIVGVVGDVRQQDLETEPRATIYWPPGRFTYPFATIAIRTAGDPRSIVSAAVDALHQIDPNVAAADIRTMEDVLDTSVAQRRLTMMLLAGFAGLALILAAVGIYGVIAYSVTQRTQEIGIRMALGAQRGAVMRLVLGEAMTLAAVGLAAGAGGAWLLTRLMQKLLYGVTPSDPLTFATVAAALALVAAAAAAVPGLRATRVDPVVALRAE
ncbi:MAG TPA: ABC transporter permease [Vicinamibacterales bacterium]|nr:ABC transporter permease [Vicinamibacterales bacterium]